MKSEFETVNDPREGMKVKLISFEGMEEVEKLFVGKNAVVRSILPGGTHALVEISRSNPSRKINWPKAALIQKKKEI